MRDAPVTITTFEPVDVAAGECVHRPPRIVLRDVGSEHVGLHQCCIAVKLHRRVAQPVLGCDEPSGERRKDVWNEGLDGKWLGAVVDQHRTRMKGGLNRRGVQAVDATAVTAESIFDSGTTFELGHLGDASGSAALPLRLRNVGNTNRAR